MCVTLCLLSLQGWRSSTEVSTDSVHCVVHPLLCIIVKWQPHLLVVVQPLNEALLLQILHISYVQGSTSPQCVGVGGLLAEVTDITQPNLQPASTDIFQMA